MFGDQTTMFDGFLFFFMVNPSFVMVKPSTLMFKR